MTNPIESFVRTNGWMVLDGGLATELERRGADVTGPLWSGRVALEKPGWVEEVHVAYFEAGADVATTVGYQVTLPGLRRLGLSPDAAEAALRETVELARRARDRYASQAPRRPGRSRPLVAASVGSYGAFLADGSEYTGAYALSSRELARFHRRRIEVLAETRADVLALETIPSVREAEALVETLDRLPAGTDIVCWLSFQCRDGHRLADGTPLREAVSLVGASPRVAAVGVNCVAPKLVRPLLDEAAAATGLPLVAYPNRGDAWDPRRRAWRTSPSRVDFGAFATSWYAAGARLIGGCCRTTPDDIRRIARALRTLREP